MSFNDLYFYLCMYICMYVYIQLSLYIRIYMYILLTSIFIWCDFQNLRILLIILLMKYWKNRTRVLSQLTLYLCFLYAKNCRGLCHITPLWKQEVRPGLYMGIWKFTCYIWERYSLCLKLIISFVKILILGLLIFLLSHI